jgi:hypothetical protein
MVAQRDHSNERWLHLFPPATFTALASDSIVLPPRTALPRLDDRIPLGAGDALRVSPFCLGMVIDPDTVLRAFDRGINFFFITADMHWPLYDATRVGVARLLARGGDLRDRIVVAGVSYCTQPEFCVAPYLELLDAVPALEHLDVLVAGGAYGHEIALRIDVYRTLLDRGHAGARALGIAFHDREAAARSLELGTADIVYVRYNPGHPGARESVFPAVTRLPKSPLFGFKSTDRFLGDARLRELGLKDHHWRPSITDYYRFALTSAEMDGLLCALTVPAEVDALAAALERGPLSERECDYLLDLGRLDSARLRQRRG